ncbi:MAG: VTT domain-containing protein [Opitutaceae bacterium]|jgi:uncharacterized membrane protein YdjX (TVP38/TMEM64 family)|nr:VTT domain-containing protein [Opitutaceae bacterium]
MESSVEDPKSRKGLIIKLAVLGVVGVVVGGLVLRGLDLRGIIEQGLALVRDAGPVAFFCGMAVLPAVGFPLSPFTLTAGSVFAPTLGWPLVIAATWAALAVNVSITYVIARWIARPGLEKLTVRLGYKWPEVHEDNYWDITLLARVTPGPPFVLQGIILGLARVPYRIYLIGSALVAWAYGTVFVVFGDALLAGKGKMIVFGFSAMVALGLGAHLLRQHLARKKKAGLE